MFVFAIIDICDRARGGEGGDTLVVHGRSRMTIDPRIPTMPGRAEHVGFHRPGSRVSTRYGVCGDDSNR